MRLRELSIVIVYLLLGVGGLYLYNRTKVGAPSATAREAALEGSIRGMEARMDSIRSESARLLRANDSASKELAVINGRVSARSRSIDSLRSRVRELETARIAQGNKEKVDDSSIRDVNAFVDSMLTYRDGERR